LGTNQTVFMRGATTANTLILVDGIPANDPSGISSEFDLNHFSIDQIERVEILKGAQSVLYGSDAVAGVINIITRKQSTNKPIGFNLNAAAGTYGTFKGGAGISGKTKAINYNLQYSRLQSHGFSAAYDNTGNQGFDDDGYRQDVLGFNMTAQATKNWKLRLFGQYSSYFADIDDGPLKDDKNNTINNKNLQVGIASVYQFNKNLLNVNFNLNTTDRNLKDEVNNPVLPGDYDPSFGKYKGKTFFAEAFTNLYLIEHVNLLAGVDLRGQSADIETTYGSLGHDSLNSNQVSAYASLQVQSLKGFNVELGGRFTNHSEFGSAFTYSFNPSYLINKQVKVFANISSGFRSPSLYHIASEYGNKDLEPEKSMSYEGGVQFVNNDNTLNLRATVFSRHIKDVIIFKSTSVSPYGQYGNADKQDDKGFELETRIRPSDKWNITANYAFVDGEITTKTIAGKDTSYNNLLRRPKNTFNATVGFQPAKKLFTSVGFRWVDKRDDQYYNTATFKTEKKELSSYYNLDAYASYQLKPFIKLFADFRNITNQQYFDLYGYNTRKFNFMAGINMIF
jgi:vitamin B12 transporter